MRSVALCCGLPGDGVCLGTDSDGCQASSLPSGVCGPLWGSLHRVWHPGGTGPWPVRGPDQALHRSVQDWHLPDLFDLRGLCRGECPLLPRPFHREQPAAWPEQIRPRGGGPWAWCHPPRSAHRCLCWRTCLCRAWRPEARAGACLTAGSGALLPGVPAAGTDHCAGHHLRAAGALRLLRVAHRLGAGGGVLLPRGGGHLRWPGLRAGVSAPPAASRDPINPALTHPEPHSRHTPAPARLAWSDCPLWACAARSARHWGGSSVRLC